MTGTVILNVVIVLGIIVAGGFLIFFMGDLLMSIVNPKKDEKKIKAKEEKAIKKMQEKIDGLSPETAAEVKKDPEVANLLYNGVVVENYNPDAEEAAAEAVETVESDKENSEMAEVAPVTADIVEETAENTSKEVVTESAITEEMDEAAKEEAERTAYIEQRRRELMERLARMSADEEDDDDETEDETDNETVQDESEDDEVLDVTQDSEATETDISDETIETTETESEMNEDLMNARKALEEAKAKNETLLAELNFAKAQMAQEQNVVEAGESILSIEDYAAKLAVDQERLKVNEKELRACKKEYFPLRRVKKTLENDEKKLRRKEALVAKQKVMLYGVNNYSDIDEEKAKKLAEDLDLLDGLKLSVEHCEEVMAKNKDRYPLLEKMYNILAAQNNEIKADIEKAEVEIAKRKNDTDTEPNE